MTSSSSSHTLLADVGGTNARFALAAPSQHAPLLSDSIKRYRVADYDSLADAARQYLSDTGAQVSHAVLAIAGRIVGDEVHATNSPWKISAPDITAKLDIARVKLVNDFAAMSMSVPLLTESDLEVVGDAAPAPIGQGPHNFAVLGPGTGLGVGGLIVREGKPYVLETEGGHTGFAPENDEETAIREHLRQRYGHRISNERLICGRGLQNIYEALADIHGRSREELTPEQITTRANEGSDETCVHAVEVFCAVFGAVAGDVALTLGAWDGVYLAGGMPPLLLSWLRKGAFRERFGTKGRLSASVQSICTRVITHPYAGLLGAAAMAVIESGRSLLPPEQAPRRAAAG
ncbi:glucokinase [Oleiagrimonas sp. C23AA]|uniref:glucokinase n=1 Tax=Oleiagrimonas sp. C23AA TaxID=2719047 RepID=UPI0014227EFE|nr:glucokinase [Oleiagrimonas sp. C23AA]NII11352.1 glucokinase [Oleiagrimonas sp. C23AA]